ncbi:MAG TPA: hypothetical protein VKY85_12660 [Candidatus Angelobacter sp.]|nr:hypothetical protein [Candidatus Angelobacter sp.]
MSGASHVITVTSIGVENPVDVAIEDTVQWFCEDATSASITFPQSGKTGPFAQAKYGLGGTVNLTTGQKSSTYTVSSEISPGTYPYEVTVKSGNATLSYSCSIVVVQGGVSIGHGLVG